MGIRLSSFCHSSQGSNLPGPQFLYLLIGNEDAYLKGWKKALFQGSCPQTATSRQWLSWFFGFVMLHPKSTLKDWCWNRSSNILATWCEELTHWKRPWHWERLKARGEGAHRRWDSWWHHRLNGHEFEQTLGNGEGQGSLVCYSPWDHKESDTIWWLNNEQPLLSHGPLPASFTNTESHCKRDSALLIHEMEATTPCVCLHLPH